MVHMAMVRQADGFVACEWGCRAWVGALSLITPLFSRRLDRCSLLSWRRVGSFANKARSEKVDLLGNAGLGLVGLYATP